MKIILASGSKWRKRLLIKNKFRVEVCVSDFEEKAKSSRPASLALYNARGKAKLVSSKYKSGIVVGVDTIGVIGKTILLKPRDRAHAARMIKMLSGKRHKVISGICVINARTKKRVETTVTTFVKFRDVKNLELEKYLDSNHWQGKAGSYAIQGRAKGFVEKIDGDITNVIGLPIPTLKKILDKI